MTIEQIYTDYRQTVFAHVMSVVKNVHDSEEITNDVFIKMFSLECANYDDKKGAALKTWIYRITNHKILDFFRTNNKQGYFTAVSDFVSDESSSDDSKIFFNFVAPERSDADALVLTDELQERIVKAFHELKPKYRRVATLFFIRGYGYTEISEMLNVPMGTVKGMLSRAREVLQTELDGTLYLRTVKAETAEA